MSQDKVNVGIYANDGTGDPLRQAFIKLNDDFTEIFTDFQDTSNTIANLTSNIAIQNAHTFMVIQEMKNDFTDSFIGIYANSDNLTANVNQSFGYLLGGFANLTGVVSNNSNTVVVVDERINALTTTVATLNLYNLMDVSVTDGPGIANKYLMWDDTSKKWVANSVVPTVFLSAAQDVSFTPGPGINGYTLVYNYSLGQWVATPGTSTLAGMFDVSVTEDETSNNKFLMWSQDQGFWIAKDIPTPVSSLDSLTDVVVVENASLDGKVLQYSNSQNAWIGSDVIGISNAYTDAAIANVPYDIGGFVAGPYTSSERVFQFNTVSPFTLPANFEGSTGSTSNVATQNMTFTIWKNAANVGTMVFYAANANAGFYSSGTTTFLPGDYLRVEAPVIVDATLADFSFTFKGKII